MIQGRTAQGPGEEVLEILGMALDIVGDAVCPSRHFEYFLPALAGGEGMGGILEGFGLEGKLGPVGGPFGMGAGMFLPNKLAVEVGDFLLKLAQGGGGGESVKGKGLRRFFKEGHRVLDSLNDGIGKERLVGQIPAGLGKGQEMAGQVSAVHR